MSRRVKPVQDQKMKRRRAVIVGSSSDNGQSRTVLERPQGVDLRQSTKGTDQEQSLARIIYSTSRRPLDS